MIDRPSADAALDGGRIVVDGRSIGFEPGDSVAIAILRTREVPGYDGILCLAGDCGNCLADVDGIAYVRTCQIAARRGLVVTRHLPDGLPSLLGAAAEPRSVIGGHEIAMAAPPALGALDQIAVLVRALASRRKSAAPPPRQEAKNSQKITEPEPPATATMPDVGVVEVGRADVDVPQVEVSRADVDVAVIGGGPSGREAAAAEERKGRSVLVLDAGEGNEVVAIYPGPLVVARTPTGMLHVHARRVVVATGAAEIHAVAPGSQLSGLLTARAAERMHAAGIPLGDAVAIGTPPAGLSVPRVAGRLVRFDGDDAGRVSAVVTADEGNGAETRTPAETVILGLGLAPRDLLARMAGTAPVRVVGEAAGEQPLPPPPTEGVVCPCSGTTVADLEDAWDRGFQELELLKRSSLACLGTCQGGACLPHVRSWIAARTGSVPDPFTARPASRQITLAEAAADTTVDVFRRTPLHDEHLALGAQMDRFGGWWRPWHYGDVLAEYTAVREAVSLGDVSTLGKLVVSGPDVVECLERLYPCHVADIKPGRSRYALLLNERGHVMDDGMIVRESETRFVLSFTSGGAANAEMWIRDWIDTWRLRVHVMDRTMSLAAINVTGPLARALLVRAGLAEPPRFLGHVHADIAGVPCHVMRLSFTGEAAFELHHPVDRSVELWRALMQLGRNLGIRPHGLQALFGLRLEKGHVIVGMDTELDTTPRRIGMDWAVRMEKPRFIGRAALERTAKLDDERRWMGFTMDGQAPTEGSPIWADGEVVGNVTGSWTSPRLGKALVLGWQKRTPFRDRVQIDGREAVVTPTPFYDPEGLRARS
jgi:glycine cleavage system aminomethyltransferase T